MHYCYDISIQCNFSYRYVFWQDFHFIPPELPEKTALPFWYRSVKVTFNATLMWFFLICILHMCMHVRACICVCMCMNVTLYVCVYKYTCNWNTWRNLHGTARYLTYHKFYCAFLNDMFAQHLPLAFNISEAHGDRPLQTPRIKLCVCVNVYVCVLCAWNKL